MVEWKMTDQTGNGDKLHVMRWNETYGKTMDNTVFERIALYLLLNEPRQANLCLRAFRHDKF